jgi:hypothetical protein
MHIDQLERIEELYDLTNSSKPVQIEITLAGNGSSWFGEYVREGTVIYLKSGIVTQCIDIHSISTIGVRNL